MNDAWTIIKTMNGVKVSIDVGKFGLCVWNPTTKKSSICLDFHTKTGNWKIGQPWGWN